MESALHKDHLNHNKINQKQCDEKEHPPLSLNKWKLRQDQINGEHVTTEQILSSEDKNKSKRVNGYENYSQGSDKY